VRALLLATLLLAGCAAGTAAPAPRAGSAGVTVELPPGWHSIRGYDVNVTDPLTRVVVSSSEVGPGDSACQTSAYTFADDAVALVLIEWWGPALTPGTKNPPRPSRFTPESLGIRRGVHECYPGRSGAVFFEDAGRTFGAYVFLGDDAPDSLVDELCAVLDSLEVRPASARSGAWPPPRARRSDTAR
jgi:hypothetical protein